MAEHDADREPQPIDEDAAWAAIVAGYGEEPADPPGAKPFKSVDDLALLESEKNSSGQGSGSEPESAGPPPGAAPEKDAEDIKGTDDGEPVLGGSVVFAPGVGGGGPRDYSVQEPREEDFDEGDEGHFVPPEPPPLPEADVTAKFAWLAVVGGPVLMLIAVLLQWDMTWWLTTICVGGFLGGFATLVARMQQGDDEDDDPGRGAVV
ncbi:hypothetical protein KQY30_26840 [Streptomyces sp. GMY02]|uniref:hypothetical protein n=1 Tax=Streptomyces sp. GMY02 TaxID=1333528 RepID=UPI001C2BF49A|nr:hypothetical protein [Streptomyces sp. GMY02]QXE37300.1 hypothetical protein KQY30_26840 [Streptomyces sp. GMY02]